MNEQDINKLSEIGLTEHQIAMVFSRLNSSDAVDEFVNKWKLEKGLNSNMSKSDVNPVKNLHNSYSGSNHNNAFDVERGIYETRRSMPEPSRAYTRTQDLNQSNLPYVPRILPKTTARDTNKEINQKYQEKSQSRNGPDANLDIMCAQLFGNSPNGGYTKSILDKKYRELALQFHPDKYNGDASRFHMLQTCYKHLKNSIFDNISESKPKKPEKIYVPPPDSLFDSKFDPSVFNKYYESNSLKKTSSGYGDWLKEESKIQTPSRPSKSNFNSEYENHKRRLSNNISANRYMLVKHPDVPEENYKENGAELLGDVEDENTDFTGASPGGIQYTDVRRALETPHLIYESSENIDIDKDISKSFASAKSNLGSIPSNFSNQEKEQYKKMQDKKRELEEDRRYRLQNFDEEAAYHFEQIHHNRLGA